MGVAISLSETGRTTSQDGSGVSVSKPGEAGLKALADYLASDMLACNQVIVDRMQSPVALIPQLAAHLVAAGGKRLRPLLTLAAARMCGYNNQDGRMRHVEIAACVEFIHTATLLHDDVVDDSQLRRGLASANAIFGNKASVLVGDFLFARSFQILTADASLGVMAILSAASATLAEGEVMQMTTQNDLSTSVDQYLQVIYGKTAALFAAACESGAVIGEATPEQREALRMYGANLGMAFQLVDDALDYAADQATLGKEVGDDFREGKVTLPVLAAYEAGNEEDRIFWRRVIEECDQHPGDLEAALDRIAKTNAIGITLKCAEDYAAKARENLSMFPDDTLKNLLLETASYSASRER
ncbi:MULTISPECIES: polyprenyl synthetase family protein [Acetobacter]|uniref:Octaprenyl diphosphate synthase n=1 Tax=Acetobacter oryzoeni TaxID=2500548 RepID=A0A5B9GFY6_9PROT|nr:MULTISPECIES: polyprenyl synthetase family protein [Acetobacter]AKR49084.1 farnesyltranstransferase [Acetobacter pasteurianus]MCP1201372.1 polyprenyl synthetase family protein [Acetobacter oryzoeni]NLG90529.1 polyprenyl synthetase family protein [Acetobacter sp.]QEE85101.1 polyprenyl synthetase family protein [Acetobacter oryzoeni]